MRRVLFSSSQQEAETPPAKQQLVAASPPPQAIEIGESPQASPANSESLFIPLNEAADVPSQDFAVVQPSAPPSSYDTHHLPESSQAVPESSADGSSQARHLPGSTTDAASQAPVPTTTSGAASQINPPYAGVGRIVPDSQSLPTSLGLDSQTPDANAQNSAGNQLVQDLQVVAQDSQSVHQTSPVQGDSGATDQTSKPLHSPSQRQPPSASNKPHTGKDPSSQRQAPAQHSGAEKATEQAPSENPGQANQAALFSSGNSQIAPDFQFSSQLEHREPAQQAFSQPTPQAVGEHETYPPVESTESAVFPFQTQIAASNTSTDQRANSQPAGGRNKTLLNLLGQTSKAASVPLGDSTALSSIPSQPLPGIGESAPPHPDIPSTPTAPSSADMDKTTFTSEPTNDLHAQLRALRARKNAERRTQTPTGSAQGTPAKPSAVPPSAVPPRLNAELAAETPGHAGSTDSSLNGGRSPSAVPAALPIQMVTQEEQNTSERYKTLLPQPKENSSLRRQSTITGTASKENSKPGNFVHSVPIALMGHQRDAYPTMIQQHKDMIERFLGTNQPGDALTAEIEALLERLRRIVVHPDLDNVETWTQYDVPPAAHAKWAIDCSAKFGFLKHLIDELKDQKLTFAVICHSTQLLEITENFLLGFKISCYRADTGNTTEQEGCFLNFNIIKADEDISPDSVSADVIVCLDNSAEGGSALQLLQESNTPLMMAFVVPGTVEHVERCLSPDLNHHQRLRATMHGVFDLRHEAGKLEHGQLPSAESAKVIADYIKSAESDKEWSIAALSMLENLDSQTESDVALPPSGVVTHAGDKRSLDQASETEMSPTASFKRPRFELNGTQVHEQPATINPMQLDISHVSDSANQPDASNMNAAELFETNNRLQHLLLLAQDRLASHEIDLSNLQYRFEEQSKDLIEKTRMFKEAMETARKAVERMEEGSSTISTLRAQIRTLKEERNASNAALADHTVPDRAAFEKQRLALAQAQEETKKLEQRLKTCSGDLDYAQEMYQNSSSNAHRLATTNKELENSLAHAQNRASGEQARARQMTLDARAGNLVKENKQLKAKVREQTEALQRKDKDLLQLKEASRGRMGTRGTSVPRSPRMASPLKGVGGNGGSRQSSPAAGELRGKTHPLRQGG